MSSDEKKHGTEDVHHELAKARKKLKHYKHQVHEEVHEGEGPWIVSYADMMTLLFCFFVIMTTFANFDPQTVTMKSAEIGEHFAKGEAQEAKEMLQGLAVEVGGLKDLQGVTKVEVKDGVLQIVFSSSILFKPAEIDLNDDMLKKLDVLIGLIKSKNPDYRIMIEGHTDNSKISKDSHYRSNWDLSAARAASIVERFVYYGFNGKQLVSIGYGDSRPVVPNNDKFGVTLIENQSLNRRVIIKVLQPLKSTKKLGFDSYFEESEINK